MEKENRLDVLLKKTETYVTTSVELFKHETILSIADLFSIVAVKAVVSGFLILFLLFANISLSLYLGSLFGTLHLGFFVVALFYLLLTILVVVFGNKWIQLAVSNFIISKLKKENEL